MESLENWLTRPEGMATRLRELRVRAGRSGKQLADAIGWAQSKVSRIETGKQMPTEDDIRAWAQSCAAADRIEDLLRLQRDARVANLSFRERMRAGQVVVQQGHNRLVDQATLIRDFETAFVPGLLQVTGYARRVLTEMVHLHELVIDDVDAAVSARMHRQQALYEPGKEFEFLITESVLRLGLCPPSVMHGQLDRLQTVIGLDRVRFGIIPFGRQLRWTPQNSVQLYVGDETVAEVESLIGQTWHRGAEADRYARAVDLLWEEAVEGEDTRRLIVDAARALPDV